MINERIVYTVLLTLVLISFYIIILIFLQKYKHTRYKRRVEKTRDYIFKVYIDQKEKWFKPSKHMLLKEFIEISEQMRFDETVKERFILDLKKYGYEKYYLKSLNSPFIYKRKRAAFYLSYLESKEAIDALKSRYLYEKNKPVQFYLLHALRNHIDVEIIKQTVNNLTRYDSIHNKKLSVILINRYHAIRDIIITYEKNTRFEVVIFLLHIASRQPDIRYKNYCLDMLERGYQSEKYSIDEQKQIFSLALLALAKQYPETLNNETYLKHADKTVLKTALKALSMLPSKEHLYTILDTVDGTDLDEIRIDAIASMLYNDSTIIVPLIDALDTYNDETVLMVIAVVLSTKIDYLMVQFTTFPTRKIVNLLLKLIELGHITEIIDFLNMNRNKQYEYELLELIKVAIEKDVEISNDLRLYLKPRLLEKLEFEPLDMETTPSKKINQKEIKKIKWLRRWLVFSIIFLPLIFLIRTRFNLDYLVTYDALTRFVIEYNYYMVVYYISVNLIYLVLIFLSYKGAKEQIRNWEMKKLQLLFEKDLLPSISIIAPAYNEALSIIESVTALLNLRYPKYEVIVVNDGSKDATLKKMIEHFSLEKRHIYFDESIKTKDVRGIYITKKIPNLVVVDKQNGGKADALNVGINIAKHAYVCGIDADSLLEGDALLKLLSTTIDHEDHVIALGGNIQPANGATINQGKIEENHLAKNWWVRFQSLEYLRAFTTGRIGWAKLKSLLIISGAFGVFDKQLLIEAGGYLTSSTDFKKDTVGEDMELVVRLTKNALIKKKPYHVDYVYNAHCYTELPEDGGTLLKQRNRWHRGLLDILSYHRDIGFKARYKQVGTLGYPYFLIYEMIGPLLEFQGFIMLGVALALGLLNLPIILAIFIATIGLGIVISLSSLYILEREQPVLSMKETFVLILVAIIENFGYRQLMSLYRARAYFSALKEQHTWGEQKRKGFKK